MNTRTRLLRMGLCLLASIVLAGCMPPYKNYQRTSSKQIDEYYSAPPKRPFEEIRLLSIAFRELGYITGRGSDEMLIGMLKDKAAALNADGIMDIKITSQPAGSSGELNLLWQASALAIRYTD